MAQRPSAAEPREPRAPTTVMRSYVYTEAELLAALGLSGELTHITYDPSERVFEVWTKV